MALTAKQLADATAQVVGAMYNETGAPSAANREQIKPLILAVGEAFIELEARRTSKAPSAVKASAKPTPKPAAKRPAAPVRKKR